MNAVLAEQQVTLADFGKDPFWLVLIKVVVIFVALLLLPLFTTWYERRVVSLIYVENPRSAAVARRLGMRPERVLEWAGLPQRLWAVEFDCPQAPDGR